MPDFPPPTPAAPLPMGDAQADAVTAAPQSLCDSAELAERGRGVGFDVLLWGRAARAFALRVDGRVVAYINRCAHVPVEMDWQEGRFLDDEGRAIVCTVHGASYSPDDGRCLGGPCGRGRLIPVAVTETGGRVHWYPSRDVTPVPEGGAAPAGPSR